jgi:hypothetical protein
MHETTGSVFPTHPQALARFGIRRKGQRYLRFQWTLQHTTQSLQSQKFPRHSKENEF